MSIDLQLSDEQIAVRESVRRFVEERILPDAIGNDIAHRLDRTVVDDMASMGLLGMVIRRSSAGRPPTAR